ncbi:MAG: octanoyltransferase [Cohnella sp.]|jgi:lipoate-protein ligase A|nr:octanoyltransferase [Cohnella sp.]
MAIDEALLIAHQEGLTPPTLRFYGWDPATLSIGYFQRAAEEVDLERLHSRGVGFVRRPTGGRAVLHARELTYSIVVGETYPGIPVGVEEACRVLSEGLLQGFRRLGIDARMSREEGRNGSAPAKPDSSACFDAPSQYELVWEGRKIAGSSQMRAKGVILQHGSIPLELDADLLFDVLRFGDEEDKLRKKRIFERKAAAIGDCLRNRNLPLPKMSEIEQAFLAGFEEGLSIIIDPGTLSFYEEELAARLAAAKYGTDEWNLRR